MRNWLNAIDVFSKRISESMTRKLDRKDFIRTSLSAIFMGVLAFAANPTGVLGASVGWCQVSRPGDIACAFPGVGHCRNAGATCPSSSSTSKCPSGWSVNYKYYSRTGCWCNYYSGLSRICCDCQRNNVECGCSWVVQGR